MHYPSRFLFPGLIVLGAAFFVIGCSGGEDIVIMDFEGETYGGWQTSGQSFGEGPAGGSLDGQRPVSGYEGSGLANSFHEGEKAQGTLTSPEFVIQRKFITFLIGGGSIEGETCVVLLVDRKVVRSQTGMENDTLEPQTWDVADFKGKTARIKIIDSYSGEWGYVLADRIVQTNQK